MLDKDWQILKKWLWGLGSLAAFTFLAWQLGKVGILILLSFLMAYILNPLVTRLARIRPLGRASATLITLFGLAVGIFTVLFFLVPHIAQEFRIFVQRLPSLVEQLQTTVSPFIERHFHVQLPQTWNDVFEQVYEQIRSQGDQMMTPLGKLTRILFGTTFMAIFVLMALLMFPVFLFFLLKDFPVIIDTVDSLIPRRNQETVRRLAAEIDRSLSAYLHGQFTVMLVLGSLYSTGYFLVGIPLGLGVGLLTGLLCFIPYLGAATGFALALLMAVFSFSGWEPILGVCAVFGTVQLMDAVFITPRILGQRLGVEPLWIIVALMAGSEMFGFLGVLLAVPTMAVLKILVAFTIDTYKKSYLYSTGAYRTLTPTEINAPAGPGDGDAALEPADN